MKYCEDNNAMIICAKINAIREIIFIDAPNVLANDSKLERVFRCQRYTTVNLSHELKSNSFGFIPRTCFNKLCTGGTIKSNVQLIA